MDVMKLSNGKRKKWVIIALSIVIVAIIGVVAFFLLGKHNGLSSIVDKPTDKVGKGYSISPSNPVVGGGDAANLSEKDQHKLSNIVIPTIKEDGKVKSYTDNSTYADLVVSIGGDVPSDKSYKMIPTGIVFDASKHVPMLPSQIKEGDTVQVLAVADTKTSKGTAEAVILNKDANIAFSPVMEVGTMENKDIALVNSTTKTRYIVTSTTPTTNMLNSLEYEKDKFKIGDRVFFYENAPNDKLPKQDEKGFNLVYVSKAFVYPAPL